MSDGASTALVAVVMVVGLAGTVVPVVPGLLVIWGGALAYGFLVGFDPLAVAVLVVLTIVLAVSFALSILLPRRMAQSSDVSTWSQWAAVVGAIIGFFTIPVVGVVVGAVAGLFAAELVHHRDPAAAWSGSVAVAKGFGLSALVDLALAALMISVWSLWAAIVVLG